MKAQRLANLELLRITAMLFIIIGHALFHSHLSPKELSLHNYWADNIFLSLQAQR